MAAKDVLFNLLMDRPVAYHADISKALGSVTAGLFIAQAMYWTGKGTDPDGWFYKTQAEWYEELGMGRREQETARKSAKQKGVLEEERRGVPAKLFYRVNFDRLIDVLQDYYDSKDKPNNPGTPVKSSLAESAKLECTNPPIQDGGIRQTRKTESDIHSITEMTTEMTDIEYRQSVCQTCVSMKEVAATSEIRPKGTDGRTKNFKDYSFEAIKARTGASDEVMSKAYQRYEREVASGKAIPSPGGYIESIAKDLVKYHKAADPANPAEQKKKTLMRSMYS